MGLDTYVEAGGEVLRDLFQTGDGGWLQDAALLETMVTEKLNEEAEAKGGSNTGSARLFRSVATALGDGSTDRRHVGRTLSLHVD